MIFGSSFIIPSLHLIKVYANLKAFLFRSSGDRFLFVCKIFVSRNRTILLNSSWLQVIPMQGKKYIRNIKFSYLYIKCLKNLHIAIMLKRLYSGQYSTDILSSNYCRMTLFGHIFIVDVLSFYYEPL